MTVIETITPATSAVDALLETIRERRSYALHQLSPEPIALDAVELMLEAANWAPSHGQTEPWRFTVYVGEGRRGLSEAFGMACRQLSAGKAPDPRSEQAQRDKIWQAPVWISLGMAPALDERGRPRMPEWEEQVAVGCAVHNAHLAAAALGLGAKWTSGAVARHAHVARFVGLHPPAQLLGFLYVGRPAIARPVGTRGTSGAKVRWVTDATSGS